MLGHKKFCSLYILHYGDFFKLGVSTTLRSRIILFDRKIEEELRIEKSLYWKMNRPQALFMERHLKNTFRNHLIGHDASTAEIFDAKILSKLKWEVEMILDTFGVEVEEKRMIEVFSTHYLNGNLRINFTEKYAPEKGEYTDRTPLGY